jgi:hypothetical protein
MSEGRLCSPNTCTSPWDNFKTPGRWLYPPCINLHALLMVKVSLFGQIYAVFGGNGGYSSRNIQMAPNNFLSLRKGVIRLEKKTKVMLTHFPHRYRPLGMSRFSAISSHPCFKRKQPPQIVSQTIWPLRVVPRLCRPLGTIWDPWG